MSEEKLDEAVVTGAGDLPLSASELETRLEPAGESRDNQSSGSTPENVDSESEAKMAAGFNKALKNLFSALDDDIARLTALEVGVRAYLEAPLDWQRLDIAKRFSEHVGESRNPLTLRVTPRTVEAFHQRWGSQCEDFQGEFFVVLETKLREVAASQHLSCAEAPKISHKSSLSPRQEVDIFDFWPFEVRLVVDKEYNLQTEAKLFGELLLTAKPIAADIDALAGLFTDKLTFLQLKRTEPQRFQRSFPAAYRWCQNYGLEKDGKVSLSDIYEPCRWLLFYDFLRQYPEKAAQIEYDTLQFYWDFCQFVRSGSEIAKRCQNNLHSKRIVKPDISKITVAFASDTIIKSATNTKGA